LHARCVAVSVSFQRRQALRLPDARAIPSSTGFAQAYLTDRESRLDAFGALA
jgi:hypothetical protein